MNTRSQITAVTFGLAVIVAVSATDANAGCGDLPMPVHTAPSSWTSQAPEIRPARVMDVAYRPVSDDHDRGSNSAIVGLWKFSFVAHGNVGAGAPPNGLVLDNGFVTWHSDGTELMNSGKPPVTSSFCMGAWKQTGRATYRLNHWALSWQPDGTTFIGPTNIHEEVTVDRSGNRYEGFFVIDQYDPNGVISTTMPRVSGTVSGTRITAD